MMKINSLTIIGPVCLVLLASLSLTTSALTTFGKTNPQNSNPPPPPTPAMDAAFEFGRLTSVGRSGGRFGLKPANLGHSIGKARECKIESDCGAIQNTTCMADPRDGKTRCLCGDYSAPINGLCTNKYKAVRAPCNDNEECGEGAQCIQNNNTMMGKRCQCVEGYYEENYKCNGTTSLLTNPLVIVLSLALMILKTITYS
ncbi:hypothetical protein PV325_013735 [Microctonus aethiopoides]|nr:hypothetical protein PV325_013735 [Microctonus aethiopoides]KAK0091494.1 hypothetical protein PV326_003120 [Microctonus aethiopoides]